MKQGPTANKVISTQAEVIYHVRNTLLTLKKECERSIDYTRKNGWKPNKVLESILKRVEDEERYLLRKGLQLDDIKREVSQQQRRLWEVNKCRGRSTKH